MSAASDAIQKELVERRERLSKLQQDEAESTRSVTELETMLASQKHRLALLGGQVRYETQGIAVLEASLSFLSGTNVRSAPAPVPKVKPSRALEGFGALPVEPRPRATEKPIAFLIERRAEELDLENLSERSGIRAENVRGILAASEEAVSFETIATAMESHEPSTSKAHTAAEVGLAVLLAEGRCRVASAGADTFALTPPERSSANLGTRLKDFQGRTTTWPKDDPKTPREGSRIVIGEGSYEGGKK